SRRRAARAAARLPRRGRRAARRAGGCACRPPGRGAWRSRAGAPRALAARRRAAPRPGRGPPRWPAGGVAWRWPRRCGRGASRRRRGDSTRTGLQCQGRVPGVAHVDVHFARAEEGRGRDPFAQRAALPGVAHIIAVASTKGGVGKSTVAVNLALALAGEGRRRVGLVDADVYGPSLPIMFGTDARPRVGPDKRIHPLERYGIKLMSMGFFLDEQSPVI